MLIFTIGDVKAGKDSGGGGGCREGGGSGRPVSGPMLDAGNSTALVPCH